MLNGDVQCAGLHGDGLVRGDGPRRGGPDDEVSRALEGLQARRLGGHLEAYEDGGRGLVAILDLSLGKSGVAMLAPVHRLVATVDHAAVEHGLEDLDVGGVMLMVQRQIRVVPVAQHAEPAEAGLLELDVLDSELVAHLANLLNGRLVELLRAELRLNLVLNGLAVAVPTGDVGHIATPHRPITVDEVLRNLVHGVADVNRAVRIRRAVMKHEGGMALVLLEGELVNALLVPLRQTDGLALGKAAPHGEVGFGKVQRRAEVVLFCHLSKPFHNAAQVGPTQKDIECYLGTL